MVSISYAELLAFSTNSLPESFLHSTVRKEPRPRDWRDQELQDPTSSVHARRQQEDYFRKPGRDLQAYEAFRRARDSILVRRIGYQRFRGRKQKIGHQGSFPGQAVGECVAKIHYRVRVLQDLPIARHRAQQGREPSVFRHLQLVWLSSLCCTYQDWFLCPDRKEKEDAGLDGSSWLGYVTTIIHRVGNRTALYGMKIE